jgi:regulator of replication initiation timing
MNNPELIGILGKLGIEIVAFLALYFTVLHRQMKDVKETLKEMSEAITKLKLELAEYRGEVGLELRDRLTWSEFEKETEKAVNTHSSVCPATD